MTRVLAVGFTQGEFLAGQRPVDVFPDTLQRDDLERLVDLIHDDVEQRRTVLAVYPRWWSEPALRRLQTVRAALDSDRLLTYASPLPPLAGSVFCALAATVAPLVEVPGLLHAGLPLLERQVLPVVRLGRLGGLKEPAPSVLQHLASWWPTTTFGVSWWPRPAVRRLRRKDPSVPLPPAAAWNGVALDHVAAAAGDGVALDWVARAVAGPLDVKEVVRVPPLPLAARYWGTAAVLETAAYPSDQELLASWLTEGHRAARCPWCGEPVVSSECPFCHTDRGAAIAGREAA